MLGGSESTTGLTCGRRETVEKSGRKGRAGSARHGKGCRGRKGETGARENREKRKQHLARRLPLSHCNHCNNRSRRSSNCSDSALAMTHTASTGMVDNETFCDIGHHNVDFMDGVSEFADLTQDVFAATYTR